MSITLTVFENTSCNGYCYRTVTYRQLAKSFVEDTFSKAPVKLKLLSYCNKFKY